MMSQNATKKFLVKKGGKILAFLLAVCLSFAYLPGTAKAVEITADSDEPTVIDEFASDPLDLESTTSAENENGFIEINSSVAYDALKEMYVYTLADYSEDNIYTSVCDGMTVNETVSIEADDGVTMVLYKDDEEQEDPDLSLIKDTGIYSLYATRSNANPQKVFTFTIIGASSNIYSYSVPSNFKITSCIRDGEEITYGYSSLSMEEEGEYLISYTCLPTSVSNSIRVTIDHTAPVLKLSGVKNGKAHHAVDISDMESDGSIYITEDGVAIDATTKLTDYGRYHIILEDAAGNRTEYTFKILVYFTTGTYLFVIVFLLVVAGIVFYIWYSKKHLRVR